MPLDLHPSISYTMDANGHHDYVSVRRDCWTMPLYEIEWGGFLTNHISHGKWALTAIGAPTTLVQHFRALYASRLTALPPLATPRSLDVWRAETAAGVYLPPDPPAAAALAEAGVAALRGQRREYAAQRAFFARKIAEGGADAALRRWLPELLPGLAGAALHPVIHLAVGLREGDVALLAEGLAYLNHSYLELVGGVAGPSRGRAHPAERYVEEALAGQPAPPVATSGRFQRAMAGLMSDDDSAAALRYAASELKMQEERMLDRAVRLYVGQAKNDYFLLHAVTASWALGVVLSSAAGLQLPAHARAEAVQALAIAAAAAAWIQGVKACNVAPRQGAAGPRVALAAAQVAIAALNAEREPRNEHVYKLVAVAAEKLRELAEEPPAGEVDEVSSDWADAIAMVMSGDFSGRGIGEKPTAKADLGDASASMHQVAV